MVGGEHDSGRQVRAVGVSYGGARRHTTRSAATIAAATGVVAWLCGDGVRVNATMDRCLTENPDSRCLTENPDSRWETLIAGIVRHGVPPHELESLLREMPEESLSGIECHVDGARTSRYSLTEVKSSSVKPRLAGRQPSNRGGVLRWRPGPSRASAALRRARPRTNARSDMRCICPI